jgi:hypothetical protein
MSGEPPLAFVWEGDVMRPLRPKYADKIYTVGEEYFLAPIEERSEASHRHEFAFLREAWKHLSEDLADIYPTPEHLRKRALIDAGYFNETIIDAGSNAAALRVAAAFQGLGDFALVIVRGPLVVRRTAKSQSRRKMNKKDFQESKDAILQIVSNMIKVSPDELQQNSGH